MNPEQILEAARKAIAAGESPDDVARWIKEAGISLEDLEAQASGFGGAGAGRSWEGTDAKSKLKTAGRAAAQAATLGFADEIVGGIQGMFDPSKTVGQAIGAQRETDSLLQSANPNTAAGGSLVGMASLGPAVGAIRSVGAGSAVRMAPAFGGRLATVPSAQGWSALAALRAMATSPLARKVATSALVGATGGAAARFGFGGR